MRFEQFEYVRPDIAKFETAFNTLLTKFEQAKSAITQSKYLAKINDLRKEFSTMYNMCHIRYSIDTQDTFYKAENDFYNEFSPTVSELNNRFYRLLLKSPFRNALEAEWGDQIFTIAELTQKTIQPSILEDMQTENKLTTEYMLVKAAAKIHFRGHDYNHSNIYEFEISQDRQTRKEAAEAKWRFYEDNVDKLEGIFDDLVKVRHNMATELGYTNYVELGYANLMRSDYNKDMVAGYREQIRQYVVPLATELYRRQRQRLGLDKLYYYDEDFKFKSGNATPKGTPEDMVANASKMYSELSEETNDFFNFMREANLMSLVAQDGKQTGGYCTFIEQYKAPFIFANFNGTSADVDVLTHEAGHAFQVYLSRNFKLSEYHWPTYEACEIHSMSMEFFTWPWMHLFFGADTEKYHYSHLTNAILFLPYGVAVEFQHFVYENPEATPAERNAAWRKIEQKYLPERNYHDNAFLDAGRYWLKQNHIFRNPFYYIDYTLAQICAFQFWKRNSKNHEEAWSDYVKLCKAGGSMSFVQLVKYAGLRSPFEEGCVASVIDEIRTWLDSVDDTKF